MARTKILATLGPASVDKIEELIEAGVDGFRFNLAHKLNQESTIEEDYKIRGQLAEKIRSLDENVFLSADLEGPKIRFGYFESLNIHTGDEVCLVPNSIYQGKGVPIQFEELYKYVKEGNVLLVDDGKANLRVKGVDNKERVITCIVEYGDVLKSRKGINLPGTKIPLPNFSENDMSHIKFLIENDFDFIFPSYTRTAQVIRELKEKVKGTGIKIGGKPENEEGTDNLEEIINEADIMMVPRGDWGMEVGVENVPAFQKRTIERCNILGKPVITATQMAESMMESREMKRAESTDIFNSCLDGTDITMLSGETSIGKYPLETVSAMNKVLEKAEEYLFDERSGVNLGETMNKLIKEESIADTISKAVYTLSKNSRIKAILVPTSTGYTARMIARFRIEKPVVALAYNEKVRRQLNAVWGVRALLTEQKGENDIVENSIRASKQNGYVKQGDKVIVTAGFGNSGKGSTNTIRIEDVG